jgi:hypothetical protein
MENYDCFTAGIVVPIAIQWELNDERDTDHRAYHLRRNFGWRSPGWKLRKLLPPEHLTEETKSLISVSTAVVATVSALVLGLLISNANSSFIRLGGQVTALSAEILRLDQVLRRYGPDTHDGAPRRRVKVKLECHITLSSCDFDRE